MGQAVHARGGLWIAPAAPGFDARLVGGTTVVPRDDGATLREEFDAALGLPDAVGLISWNEFSENSHVEPSRKYGERYLETVADINGRSFEADVDLDSSEPANGLAYGLPVLLVFAAFFIAGGVIIRRRRRSGVLH